MSEHIKVITDVDFEQDVIKSGKPVLIDFWAEWCGPCRALAPTFAEIADLHHEQVTFGKINIDNCPQIASKYGVMSIPTLILFKNGQVEAVKMGVLSRSQLSAFIEGHI
jgi:thioredoxin 1